ncbi:hypothetical protein ACFX14_036136 [Malus domestica]
MIMAGKPSLQHVFEQHMMISGGRERGSRLGNLQALIIMMVMVMILVMMKFFNIKLEALGANIQNTVVQEVVISVTLVSLSRLVGRVDRLPPQQVL